MALTSGSALGVYEVVSPLGSGGMGEVYRARDTRLNREVALKVLPDSFASDPDRLARFTREAQTLASLNHPNIAHIHGLEESSGVRALVMELVEGEDLSQRIARGAIPVDEALPIARQIAEALEAAHEQGIIHRDLKPANIKVRPDGTVKVLDFGLAKALQPSSGGIADVTASPTITSPAMMTGAGVILGTAAYRVPSRRAARLWIAAATSGRLVAYCMRCLRRGAYSKAKMCRIPSRLSSAASRTGRRCRLLSHRRSALCFRVALTRIGASESQTSQLHDLCWTGWHIRQRMTGPMAVLHKTP